MRPTLYSLLTIHYSLLVADWSVVRHGFARPGVLAPRSMRLLPV